MSILSLKVYVDPRVRGPSLSESLRPVLEVNKRMTIRLDGTERKNDDYGNTYHMLRFFSESDFEFEHLQEIHKGLRRNRRVTHYTLESFQYFFSLDKNGTRV